MKWPLFFSLFFLLLRVPFLAAAGSEHADRFGYCQDNVQRGWNFYCDPEQDPEPIIPEPTPAPAPSVEAPKETYTEAMETYRAEIEEKKNRAVLEPTPENVEDYMRAQQIMVGRAKRFTDVWQRVLYETPDLDANVKWPLSSIGTNILNDQRLRGREEAFRQAMNELGLVFIYNDFAVCRICAAMADVLNDVTARLGGSVLGVAADGVLMPALPNSVIDAGQLRNLGLENFPRPTLALVNPETNEVAIVGSGLLTEDLILERIQVITQIPEGERYQ